MSQCECEELIIPFCRPEDIVAMPVETPPTFDYMKAVQATETAVKSAEEAKAAKENAAASKTAAEQAKAAAETARAGAEAAMSGVMAINLASNLAIGIDPVDGGLNFYVNQ